MTATVVQGLYTCSGVIQDNRDPGVVQRYRCTGVVHKYSVTVLMEEYSGAGVSQGFNGYMISTGKVLQMNRITGIVVLCRGTEVVQCTMHWLQEKFWGR